MSVTTVTVPGMCCPNCERRVESALAEVEGVRQANADASTGVVEIHTDSGVTRAALADRIEQVGYTVPDR